MSKQLKICLSWNLSYILMIHIRTMEELETALFQLKTSKAGGLSETLPEMILCGGLVLRDKLLSLMKAVWKKAEVFRDWSDAVIVPVPKEGNLQSCDN